MARRISRAIAYSSPVLFIATQEACAYIDPGTGSYVIQAVAAGVLAGLFVVKSKWKAIKDHFSRPAEKSDKDAE